MKKLILAFSLAVGSFVTVNAQDTTSTSTQTQQYPTTTQTTQDDRDRERINSRDLPDQVKRSLEGTEYRGWLVNAAYKTTGISSGMQSGDSTSVNYQGSMGNQGSQGSQSDSTSVSGSTGNTGAYGQEVFVVELKNGAQTKTVRFDKDGNKLDGGSGNDDQK